MAHEILRPSFVRKDERGTFRELLNSGTWHSLIQGEMQVGAVMGHHYHEVTEIFFFLLSGKVNIMTKHIVSQTRENFDLVAFQGVILRPMETHAITFLQEGSFIMMRSTPYDPQNPDTFAYPLEAE